MKISRWCRFRCFEIKRELTEATGALNAQGVADRVTFIVDPNNEIQFLSLTAGSMGRNVHEVLRGRDTLQSDELWAWNWRKGDPHPELATCSSRRDGHREP